MATIRKRELKSGDYSYLIQVKFTDKGSGMQIVRTTTWKPETSMTPKQEARAVKIFADSFEDDIKETLSCCSGIAENPNITFKEYAAKWLETIKRNYSISYYVCGCDCIDVANQYIGGYKMIDLNPAIIQTFYDKLDVSQKSIITITPVSDFRKRLKTRGYTYTKLRYELGVQPYSLAKALKGKNVSKDWATMLAKKVGIPYLDLFNENIRHEPYAYETIHRIKRTVRTVLSSAKKSRIIKDNYASADFINFPKRPQKQIVVMDDEKALLFFNTILDLPDIRYKTAMLLFLLTGFRRGEITGLQWRDINLKDGSIQVNRSVVTVKGYGAFLKETKTDGSVREISIPETLINVLKDYKNWCENRHDLMNKPLKGEDFIFTQDCEKFLYPSTFATWLNNTLKLAGLSHYKLHSLRHTNITMQLAAGVPLVTVAARAGHARTSTTSDIYAHFIKSSDKSAAATIDKIFNQTSVNNALDVQTKSNDNETGGLDEFKKIKSEMKRLGFSTIEEYSEYLDFLELQRQKRMLQQDNYSM